MNKVFAVLSLVAVAAVSAAPFDLAHNAVFAVFHPVAVEVGGHKLRFLHLMPKAAHAGDFADGFACKAGAGALKHHAFLDLADHKLVELVGLADCKNWHAVHLTTWDGAAAGLAHKVFAFAAGAHDTTVAGLDALVTFVHGKVAHKDLFKALVAAGVPAHLLVLKLHAKFGAAAAL